MNSFSCTAAVLAHIVLVNSIEARGRLRPQKKAPPTDNVECVIQAFGSDLEDKVIVVEVRDPGFGCGSFSSIPITNSADFIGGEAEVALTLPADNFQICTSAIVIAITLDYSCDPIPRVITGANCGGTPIRALEQQCGSTISPDAIPYIDMWCSPPASQGGQPEGMQLT